MIGEWLNMVLYLKSFFGSIDYFLNDNPITNVIISKIVSNDLDFSYIIEKG